MKRVCALFVCLAFLGVASASDGRDKDEREARNLFEFNRLTAVVPPFTGQPPARALPGAGWVHLPGGTSRRQGCP